MRRCEAGSGQGVWSDAIGCDHHLNSPPVGFETLWFRDSATPQIARKRNLYCDDL